MRGTANIGEGGYAKISKKNRCVTFFRAQLGVSVPTDADAAIEPTIGMEVRELQAALSLVATGAGISIVPASVQRFSRDEIRYIELDEAAMRSPIIMSYRRNDRSALLQRLVEPVNEFHHLA